MFIEVTRVRPTFRFRTFPIHPSVALAPHEHLRVLDVPRGIFVRDQTA